MFMVIGCTKKLTVTDYVQYSGNLQGQYSDSNYFTTIFDGVNNCMGTQVDYPGVSIYGCPPGVDNCKVDGVCCGEGKAYTCYDGINKSISIPVKLDLPALKRSMIEYIMDSTGSYNVEFFDKCGVE